uniref:Integrase catalytic domain-containing protein n=1 Tax=Globodera pallida TaxID=36090 RepID=A0A183C6X8_GLOPA
MSSSSIPPVLTDEEEESLKRLDDCGGDEATVDRMDKCGANGTVERTEEDVDKDLWAYGEYSAQIPELERQGIIVHAGAPSDEMLNKLPKPFLIVYDDLMGEIDAKKLADLYTKKSHHNNFAVIFLTQNLFDKAMRVPRSNAQYIFLMRAPNDMLSIRNLATQIFPREQGFLIDAYKQACAEPYGQRDICSLAKKMANKLILLPIEHYRGLVAARENREDDVTDQTNFGFVKQQFEKAKRKRAANVSEKSAMYNQQLRRYLKLRKEVKDKPVKVQLSNGLRLITKPPATGVQLKPGPEELEETIVIGGSEAGDDEPAAISTPKFSTPKEQEVGPAPRVRKRELKQQEIKAKKEQLLSIIKSDPKRFGVNERDKVINPSTGREFIDFDLSWAIERLVNPRPENAPSPSGTRELTKKLLQDPTAKQLINPQLVGTIPGGFMTDVQADLADFQALSRKNSGNRYLLLAVDVLSRRMFGVPVKSKKPADMKKAFEELFGQMPKLPDTLYTDRGLEFVAKPLKEFYAEKGIKKFETSSKKKAAVAERAIRTLKTRLYNF